jgi:hypothetical protein
MQKGFDFLDGRDLTTARPQLPPHNQRETSKAAAEKVAHKEGSQVERVYQAIVAAGPLGLTRGELVGEVGLPINAICGRANSLLREKRVRVCGVRKINGNDQEILVAN